jgi:hypothetical protein
MGEKGNTGLGEAVMGEGIASDPLRSLEALPLDAIKGSPETINAWLDTYLKFREAKELRKANEAAAAAAESASDAAAISMASQATPASDDTTTEGTKPPVP